MLGVMYVIAYCPGESGAEFGDGVKKVDGERAVACRGADSSLEPLFELTLSFVPDFEERSLPRYREREAF